MHPLCQATLMVTKESLLAYENEEAYVRMYFASFFFFIAVRLRIKSFRVPELFVEIPETATVGSLKVTSLPSSLVSPSFHFCCSLLLMF